MRDTGEKIVRFVIVGAALSIMIGTAVFGTSKETVLARSRTAVQPEQRETVVETARESRSEDKSEGEKQAEIWTATEEGKVANNKEVAMVSVGENSGMQGGTQVGAGVGQTVCSTPLAQKIVETGANVNMGELPYAKQSTDIGPIAKSVITNAAASRGFVPGGMFDLEIGTFTTNGGLKPCTSLKGSQTFDINIVNIPGFTPGMLMMLPDGTTVLLDNTMLTFDPLNAGKMKLRTPYPKAVYMLVYMPAR